MNFLRKSRIPLLCLALNCTGRAQEKTPAEAPVANPAPPAVKDETGPSEAGAAAVQRVRNLGFRLNAAPVKPGATAASPTTSGEPAKGSERRSGAPSSPASGETPPANGPLQVGRVKEPVSLPPEVVALAKDGALAVAERDWPKARDLYLEMVKKSPDNALAYANLGVAEHQLGNLLAAAGNLSRSTELNPHIARNWQTLGLIQYERGELTLALSSLTRAVHEDPNDAETRLILAAVVRDYGWPDAAVTELQRAVEIDPKLAAAHYNLAVTYLGLDPPRIELARRHYYAAIDLGTAPSPEIEAILKPSE